MGFEVKTSTYSGPLQLLLELIEKRQMPITEVSLAQVTDDYVAYVNAHEPMAEELADFLLVATRLLLIKSHEILPRQEELPEETSTSLAQQLQLYQIFAKAADLLHAQQQSENRCFERLEPDAIKPEGLILPSDFTLDSLERSFAHLLKRLEPFFHLGQAAMERVISVKERLKEIQEVFLTRSQLVFREMIGSGRSKVEIVVSFLALLELIKQQTVHVMQSNPFGDIEIKRAD